MGDRDGSPFHHWLTATTSNFSQARHPSPAPKPGFLFTFHHLSANSKFHKAVAKRAQSGGKIMIRRQSGGKASVKRVVGKAVMANGR
ncbi:hypothetical protein [Bifidobacterium adolescentis]|uniref:hypothetical protein n=1 Tax=Bifidobacterium adolescentis TaxID=1680 RepID=UPI0022E2A9E4|nr:hypothetical protein [Bifidobacterium adolescentis]